jgi:hypothetical protein
MPGPVPLAARTALVYGRSTAAPHVRNLDRRSPRHLGAAPFRLQRVRV